MGLACEQVEKSPDVSPRAGNFPARHCRDGAGSFPGNQNIFSRTLAFGNKTEPNCGTIRIQAEGSLAQLRLAKNSLHQTYRSAGIHRAFRAGHGAGLVTMLTLRRNVQTLNQCWSLP
jgi:hypothetical protein